MELFSANIKLCRFILLFPQEGETWSRNIIKICIEQIVFVGCYYATIEAALYQLQFEKLEVLIDLAFLIITSLGYAFMVGHFKRNAVQILDCMKKCNNFLEYCSEEVLAKGEKSARKVTRVYFIWAIVGWSINGFICLFDLTTCYVHRGVPNFYAKHDSCGIPFRNWLPWDESKSLKYFITFWLQNLGWTIIRINIVVMLATVISFFIHITNQLGYLEEYVVKVFDEDNIEKYEGKMKFCNQYHIAILNYAGEVFENFSMVFLGIFISVSAPIGIILFQFVLEDEITAKVRAVYHFLGWTGILLLICYYGQKTLDQSTGIGDAIYSSKWYKSPINLRKNILIMITRSQRPLVLSAGGVAVFSLDTFVSILKTAYSSFTLLVTTMSD